MNSSESAEAVVRMSLQGSEVALKIAGSGTKELLIMLYTILNGRQKVKGRTSLTNMLKSGKELKVFSVKQEDLKKFTQEAKRYGVLFNVLMDRRKNSPDGVVDIMVKTEDAYKINRIVDRFNLASVNIAELKSEIEKEMIDKMMKDAKEKGIAVKTKASLYSWIDPFCTIIGGEKDKKVKIHTGISTGYVKCSAGMSFCTAL